YHVTPNFKVVGVTLRHKGCDIPYHKSQDFTNSYIIGSGVSASVYAVFWKSTQTKYAIKKFAEGSAKDMILNEIEILEGVREKPISTTNGVFVKLYQKCWKHEPDKRPDIDQVISELNVINPKSHFNSKESDESILECDDEFSGCDVKLYY
ncbi:9139_t:CDS:2, partial [Funneliformis caledonium]